MPWIIEHDSPRSCGDPSFARRLRSLRGDVTAVLGAAQLRAATADLGRGCGVRARVAGSIWWRPYRPVHPEESGVGSGWLGREQCSPRDIRAASWRLLSLLLGLGRLPRARADARGVSRATHL